MSQHPAVPQRPVTGPLAAAAAALATIVPAATHQLSDPELGAALDLLDTLRCEVERVTFAVAADAAARGTATAAGASSLGDWVRTHSPNLASSEVNNVLTVVRAASSARNAPLTEGVLGGQVPLRRAARLVRALDQIAPFVTDQDYDAYQQIVLPTAQVATGSDKDTAQACAYLVTVVRPVKDSEELAAQQTRARDFFERAGAAGMTDFIWRLDPEGAAIVRAVTTSLAAKPCPDTDGPDPRGPGRRKAEALLTVLKRGMAAPDSIHTNGAIKMVVATTITALHTALHTALDTAWEHPATANSANTAATASGKAPGLTLTGEQLTPGQLRRLACEADLIPAVYGTASQLLDLGRTARLATSAQHLALALRDKGCTIPGCSMPPQFCIAHHLTWWSRGGTTDLTNLALLCERHHSTVHDHDRRATTTPTGVSWDP